MFLSGFRVSETCGNVSNTSDLQSQEEDFESMSNADHQESSGSDILNQIDDINAFIYNKRERRASLTV